MSLVDHRNRLSIKFILLRNIVNFVGDIADFIKNIANVLTVHFSSYK